MTLKVLALKIRAVLFRSVSTTDLGDCEAYKRPCPFRYIPSICNQRSFPQEFKDHKDMVLQDFGFELKDLKHALQFIHEQTEVYPIWLCPSRHCIRTPELEEFSGFKKEHTHIDIGVYG